MVRRSTHRRSGCSPRQGTWKNKSSLDSARTAAEADVRDRAAFEATLHDAERLSARVAETLRTHTADRPRANQAHRGAVNALQALRGNQGNWQQLLARATNAKQDLQNAEQWATEDIRLAAQAAQAVAEAERAVGAARSFVASGIAADSGVATSTLSVAQRSYAAQQYEQAITQAASAEQSARQALEAAEQAARMRQMQQEAERQRRHAERGGMGPVVIPNLPSFNFGDGGGGSSSSSRQSVSTSNWGGGGGISTSSWSGGISKTKW
jgi:septal ring factor EnvC (AmiA/AmiB activator)